MQVFLDIILVILAVDFGSGLLHWLEDSYGQPHWPITGKWITAPNILHHQAPSAFTENSWLRSAAVLLVIGAVIIGVAWLVGMLTWQFLLFVAIGVNANEIHKWNHLPRKKRGKLVVALQDARLLQSAKHHGKHHVGSKDTHYCVLTNLLNPVLDAVRFWHGLEWAIELSLGVSKRPSLDVRPTCRRPSILSTLSPGSPMMELKPAGLSHRNETTYGGQANGASDTGGHESKYLSKDGRARCCVSRGKNTGPVWIG